MEYDPRTTDWSRMPLEDPHDGEMLTQMNTGMPKPRFRISEDETGAVRIASRSAKNAAAMCGYSVKRLYHPGSNGSMMFFYSLSGELDNSTIDQLNVFRDFLLGEFQSDFEKVFSPLEPVMTRPIGVRLSVKHNMLYLYFEMKFAEKWTPVPEFAEV